MNGRNPPIYEALTHAAEKELVNMADHVFGPFHRHHPTATITATHKETSVSVFGDIKNVLSALDANPLIGAIAERNLGTLLEPAEVTAVANFVRDLENAKRPQASAPPTPLQQVTQQQPVQRPIA